MSSYEANGELWIHVIVCSVTRGPTPHQRAEVHDRREHHAVDRELLDPVEQGRPPARVPLAGLLLEEVVDVRVARRRRRRPSRR